MKKKKTHRKPLSHERHCVEVANRYWMGDSLREIAKSLKIGRPTVCKSLALPEAQKVFEDLNKTIIENSKKDRHNLSRNFERWLNNLDTIQDQRLPIYADLIKAAMPILIKQTTETIQSQNISPEVAKFVAELKNDPKF